MFNRGLNKVGRFQAAQPLPSHLATPNPLFLWNSFSGHRHLRFRCEVYLAVRLSHVFRCARFNRPVFRAGSSSGIFRAHLGSSGLNALFLPAFPSHYNSETVTQSVTHGLARYAQQHRVSARGNHRQKPKYRAGPYLMRRGRMFYFRKRLPAGISKFGSNCSAKKMLAEKRSLFVSTYVYSNGKDTLSPSQR